VFSSVLLVVAIADDNVSSSASWLDLDVCDENLRRDRKNRDSFSYKQIFSVELVCTTIRLLLFNATIPPGRVQTADEGIEPSSILEPLDFAR
jgi:hypothetical protein